MKLSACKVEAGGRPLLQHVCPHLGHVQIGPGSDFWAAERQRCGSPGTSASRHALQQGATSRKAAESKLRWMPGDRH